VGGGRGQGAWWAFGPLWSVGQVQNKIMVLNFHVNYKRRQPTTAKKERKGGWRSGSEKPRSWP